MVGLEAGVDRLGSRLRPDANLLLVLPAAAVVLTCFVWPVVNLLELSFTQPRPGLANYTALVTRPVYLRVLWNTAVISATVDLFCLLIGYPVAYVMATASPRTRRLLIFVVLIPFWSSVLVRSFAWMVLLQRNGLINDMLIGLGLLQRPAQLVYNRIRRADRDGADPAAVHDLSSVHRHVAH